MPTNYPGAIDSFTNPTSSDYEDVLSHAGQHSNANDAIEAIEQVLGTTAGSALFNSFTASQKPVAQIGGTVSSYVYSAGTFNSPVLGTPTIGFVTSPGTTAPTVFNRGIAPTVGTLADSAGGTITPNAAIAQVFEVTLGTTAGNRTLGTPLNPTDGQALLWRVKQNSNNTGTIVFNSSYKMSVAGTPSLGTSNSWNYFGFRYYSAGSAWHAQGNSLGVV